MVVAAVSLIVGGLVVGWVGLRTARNQLPRNWVAGLRTRTTMASDEAWYAGQRAGAGYVVAAGVVGVATGVIALFFSDPVAAAIILGGTALLLGLVVVGGVKGQRAAREFEA